MVLAGVQIQHCENIDNTVGREAAFKKANGVLAGVVQWIKCQPENQEVAGSIPSQGMCLGCGPGPKLGGHERQPIDVSLTHQCFSLFLPHSPPL